MIVVPFSLGSLYSAEGVCGRAERTERTSHAGGRAEMARHARGPPTAEH